ncbi:transposase [Corynebacterium belfantii]|uniref:transposase n=1 Tax=Corynebacterium belfantii TaxID=2014537 RepID=UPI001F23141E|nr:transposase [Corynebacterium belfantii]
MNTRPKDRRDGIDVVAMGGFSGFKTASVEELPEAVEVMDLFHVVKLAGDAPSMRYVAAFSRRPPGIADERQTRCIGRVGLCTPVRSAHGQAAGEGIVGLFANANFTAVEVTWAVYQDIVSAYRTNDANKGKKPLQSVIGCVR